MKSINVAIRGRREVRAILHETPADDGSIDRRVLIAMGWEGDPVIEGPLVTIPMDALDDFIGALRALGKP
jgi:hypothetical protein